MKFCSVLFSYRKWWITPLGKNQPWRTHKSNNIEPLYGFPRSSFSLRFFANLRFFFHEDLRFSEWNGLNVYSVWFTVDKYFTSIANSITHSLNSPKAILTVIETDCWILWWRSVCSVLYAISIKTVKITKLSKLTRSVGQCYALP